MGQGDKTLLLLGGRALRLEYSALIVDGRPDLSLVLYNPPTTADAGLLRETLAAEASAPPP